MVCGVSSTYNLHMANTDTEYIFFSRHDSMRQEDITGVAVVNDLTSPELKEAIDNAMRKEER